MTDKEKIAFLTEEYHFLCQRLTLINNIIQPLWGELRERCGGCQTLEQFLERGTNNEDSICIL